MINLSLAAGTGLLHSTMLVMRGVRISMIPLSGTELCIPIRMFVWQQPSDFIKIENTRIDIAIPKMSRCQRI